MCLGSISVPYSHKEHCRDPVDWKYKKGIYLKTERMKTFFFFVKFASRFIYLFFYF